MKAESEDEWELSKENIQPIQQGRKQKILKVALAPHPEDLILQQRHAFEHELRTYSGTDVLSVWCKYIKWVEQNFPKGGREGQIKQLIEKCLAILKDEKKYYDDERFIDILLKFANISEKPLEVFNYMYSHYIGCKSAKFFINWSWELEQLGNFKKADQILTEGIQRQAQPFEKIKAYRKEFDVRLACKIKEGTENPNFETDSRRSAFAMLKPQKHKLAPVARTGEAVIDNKNPLLLGHQRQPQPSKNLASKVPFKIYSSNNAPSFPPQSNSVAYAILNSENAKENEQKPSKWNKVKVKPRVHSIRPVSELNPSFKVHCDEENSQDQCTPRSIPKTSTVLNSRHRSPSPVIALFEPPDPLKRPMYPKSKVYGGAEEYSLEEIRAAEWYEKKQIRDQDLILKEQNRLLEQKAREKEELEKEINKLTQKMQMLKNSTCVPVSKLENSASGINSSQSKNSEMASTNQLKSDSETNILFKRQNELFSCNLKDEPENHFSKSLNNSKICSTDTFDVKGDTTSYREAAKMVQDLYNRTLSHSSDTSDGRATTEQKHITKYALSTSNMHDLAPVHNVEKKVSGNKQINELPFELYQDPTVSLPSSKFVEKLSSSTQISSQQFTAVKDEVEIKNDLPFAFYHDATENIPLSAPQLSVSGFHEGSEKDPAKDSDKVQYSVEEAENIPPKEYFQEKSKRELAGILKPSKNILYIPLEEQQALEDELDEDEDICYQHNLNANKTLIPPSNTEQFSTDLFLASTPCASRHVERKLCLPEQENANVSLIATALPKSNSLVQDENHKTASQNSSNCQQVQSKTEERPNKVLNTDLCLPKILSVIMETSSENYSKFSSSSNSSASLTKSCHLDPSHFNSVRKPCLKLDTLSSIVEVPDPVFHESLEKTDKTLIQVKDMELSQKSNLYQVDFDPFEVQETLKHLKSIDFTAYGNLYHLNKSIKSVKLGQNINTGNINYVIDSLIAEGAYAKVYQAIKSSTFDHDIDLNKIVALKVCKKSNEWEFFICCEIAKRLTMVNQLPEVKNSLMYLISAIKFTDGIILVSEFSNQGTLLDMINFYKKKNSPMPETIVMYLTLDILHIISRLHKLNIIHGDIKPDNFLVMNSAFKLDVLNHLSQSTTAIRLIDFGRAIDLQQYSKGICFTTTLNSDSFKCPEMRENKPWVFQLDWFGVLSCIYAMLFSEYISVRKRNNRWEIEKKFKRYWYTCLWEPLFSELLNIPSCYSEPNIKQFTDMIETRLQQNSTAFAFELQRLSAFNFHDKRIL